MRRLIIALIVPFLACCEESQDAVIPSLGAAQVHDAGEHVLGGAPIVLAHTFSARNQSNRSLKVVKTSSSCGCTTAKPRSESVAIGDTLEMDMEVTVRTAGARTETASIVFDDGSVQTFAISFAVRVLAESLVSVGAVALDLDGRAQIPLIASTRGLDLVPAKPIVDAPAGILATFSGWSIDLDFTAGCETDYARWKGVIDIVSQRMPAILSPDDSASILLSPEVSPVRVSLVGKCGPLPFKTPPT